MAKNITLLGANYPDVPSVVLPQTGGGSATFTDVSDTTATDSDVEYGMSYYKANGQKSTGTKRGIYVNVTPYTTEQTVSLPSGYNYITQATINAISYSEVVNAAGGKTVTIGTVAP